MAGTSPAMTMWKCHLRRLRRRRLVRSAIGAEIAAERIRLLHQRLARDDFENLPEVFLVLHRLRILAADDDDRTDALVVFGAIMHVTKQRRDGLALLVGLDDIRRIEAAGLVDHARPVREADVGVLRAPLRLI